MPNLEPALTIPQMMAAAANHHGGSIAIDDDGLRISYRELDRQRQQAARALLALEVGHGERVAIWAPNVHEWIVAALGLQSVGAVLVPLNTRMKGAEAGYILRESGASLLFVIGEFLGTDYPALLVDEALPALRQRICLRGTAEGCLDWEAFLALGQAVTPAQLASREAQVEADSLSDLLFTSGTTGKPKGVMSAHGQNLRIVRDWSAMVGLRPGDRYLIVNPFFHSFGYKAGWLAALMHGCCIFPQQVFDVPAMLERIARERVSVLPGPPTLYQSILGFPDRARYDLSSLRVAVTGAASVPVEMVRRMARELGFETIVTAYGLTEACGFVTICRPGDAPDVVATTSGRAFPDVEVRCVDATGEPVPPGQPGEVTVRGYNLMKGYFNNPEATREAIDAEGWLHTGDIGVLDEQGYLRITDRIKDMFITGGFNVYPAEIEQVILRYPGVAQAAVIGIPDERLGEVAMAFLLPAGGQALDTDAFLAWCREHMANYKVPRRAQVLSAMPLNAAGKITKDALRVMAKARA
ncbi:3-[(3aS,4S,7aS)-7a-methyl-1,5-dioxo-octahydro-1H-inden-4-yl]propanoyl:CoA ligase [Metapseudomonas otitidis]|uniref:3-[(3aS,4S,7aS)-7a-methyl-1,5-dioxo-octahydro-1H-inden-4-yl]propanoyl:CoA ligase n=1 Tax=Metapseudomonas otitidis TaxID=319939 RepID=A0A6S5RHB0_9GAMM|nr:FadD3 family acyl-CoA ligase [Pseudomonas otitidis]BBT15331.1 3-[(3aS,4S,7aS)-7a-methyl-1,5-dioxo-octahydro-1H-inden-4-yl]propanoyl:CoA ligase [Pseudomonas otitidis]